MCALLSAFVTSVAGSIGIIGIATILALSTGVNAYIARTEEEALTSYPLSIQTTGMDLDTEAEGMEPVDAPEGELTITPSFTSMLRSQKMNDLASLKRFLDTDERVREHTAAIEYRYRLTPRIYQVPSGPEAPIVQVSPDQAMEPLAPAASAGPFSSMVSLDAFHQLPATASLYEDQFDVVAGRWPSGADELVVVLDSHGALPDTYEYTLGLRDHAELDAMMESYLAGEGGLAGAGAPGESAAPGSAGAGSAGADADSSTDSGTDSDAAGLASQQRSYRYEQVLGTQFSLVPASSLYAYDDEHQVWTDRSDHKDVLRQAVEDGERLTVVGVVRAQDTTPSLTPGLAYTPGLTQRVIDQAAASEIVKDQLARPDTDVFTGRSFADLAAGRGTPSLDFTSLFTVDGQALHSAFSIDENLLQAQLTGAADVSDATGSTAPAGTYASGGAASPTPAAGEGTGAGAAASSASAASATQTPDPSATAAGTDAAAGTGTEAGTGAGGSAAGTDPELLRLVRGYLASEPVQAQLGQAIASGKVINTECLTSNVMAALGQDPALTELATQVSQDVARQVTTTLTNRLVPAMSQAIGQAIATQLAQTMGQAIAQMTQQVGQAVATQMQATTTRLASALPVALAQAMSVDEEGFMKAFTPAMSQEDLAALMSTLMTTSVPSFEGNLAQLGWADTSRPTQVDIYPTSFADKDAVKDVLSQYNADAREAGHPERAITYSDLVGALMSSVTRIVDIISWMLIAFVSISLVVSSIMIAIITYISVLERRKEIGVLRAIGASKADVRHVFNAETVIEGLLAGLIPSAKAAREDPVEALRSE